MLRNICDRSSSKISDERKSTGSPLRFITPRENKPNYQVFVLASMMAHDHHHRMEPAIFYATYGRIL